MPVRVENRNTWKGNGTWIGRAKDPKNAVFGNPFTHLPLDRTQAKYQVASREEAIRRYEEEWVPEQWENNGFFRLALSNMVRRHLRGEEIVLVCVCAPEPCHGHVLKRLIEQLADLRVVTLDDSEDNPF